MLLLHGLEGCQVFMPVLWLFDVKIANFVTICSPFAGYLCQFSTEFLVRKVRVQYHIPRYVHRNFFVQIGAVVSMLCGYFTWKSHILTHKIDFIQKLRCPATLNVIFLLFNSTPTYVGVLMLAGIRWYGIFRTIFHRFCGYLTWKSHILTHKSSLSKNRDAQPPEMLHFY